MFYLASMSQQRELMMRQPTRLRMKPSRAICWLCTWPLPKTMVLGAVATGSMKAQLALNVAGSISSKGSIFELTAVAASTGISIAVVAVLLVASVIKVTAREISAIIVIRLNAVTAVNCSPKAALKPEITKAFARQIPPLNNNKIPQGISCAVCHSSSFCFFPFGITNNATTASSATEASFAWGRFSQSLQPPNGSRRVTHSSAVQENTTITRRSWVLHEPAAGSLSSALLGRWRINHNQQRGRKITTMGRANCPL